MNISLKKKKLDKSDWIRIIVSSILLTIIIIVLKIISPLNPALYYIVINLCVVIALNRPSNYQESIITGILIGVLSGLFLSVLYLGPMIFAMVLFTFVSIIGALIAFFIFEKIIK